MPGFNVPENKTNTWRLLPPLSSQGYSDYSRCIWPHKPNLVLVRRISGWRPACLRKGSRYGFIWNTQRNDQKGPEKQPREECQNKSIPSVGQITWLFLSCEPASARAKSLILLMTLRGNKTQVNVWSFWFLSSQTGRHSWNNHELWVNINWQWKEALTNAARHVLPPALCP